MRITSSAFTAAIMLVAAVPANAQVQVAGENVRVRLGGSAMSQFATTSVDGEEASQFLLRRLRPTVDVSVGDFISARLQPDFGGFAATLADAWIRFNFDQSLRVTTGQFKRPFDLFELTSSSRILVIERDGRVSGVSACGAIGGACTFNRVLKELEYESRDMGVMVDGEFDQLAYAISMMNGTGANSRDENGWKSFSARLTLLAADNVRFGAHAGGHDYVEPSGSDEYAFAFGGDIEIGTFREGLHFMGGVALGDNWAELGPTNAPTTFTTAQAILSYRVPVTSRRITHIEPVGRVSWTDPNTDGDDNEGLLLTPGIILHMAHSRIAFNLDYFSPAVGDAEYSIKVQAEVGY